MPILAQIRNLISSILSNFNVLNFQVTMNLCRGSQVTDYCGTVPGGVPDYVICEISRLTNVENYEDLCLLLFEILNLL